jgi:cell division protein FtsA
MKQNYVISLEIGSSAAKIGAASFDTAFGAEAPVTVIAIEEEHLNNCVRYGRIQNVEDVTRHTLLALDRLSGRTGVYPRQITGVYTAIGGRSLASRKAFAEITLPAESEITNDIIERLKNEAMLQVPEGKVALDIIPLRFVLDDVVTKRPVGSFGTRLKADFTLVYCSQLNERNLERVIVERLNLDICGYVVRPLAIANLTLTDDETRPGCMLVDLGAETTTVAIFKDGALQYLATIPLGSQNITRDLAAGLGLVEEQAERIKISLGNAISDNNNLTNEQVEIDNYVQARVTEIIANIIAHIRFAEYKTSDICAGIIITGRGSKLRNFSQLLQAQSGLPVRVATMPGTIHISDPAINPSDNIDILAIAKEAVSRSLKDDAVQCVSLPEPEPQPEPEPVAETPAAPAPAATPAAAQQQPQQPQQPAFNPYDYTSAPAFGGYTDKELDQPVDEPAAPQPQQPTAQTDEEGLLLDSDEEDKLKALRQRQLEEQRKKIIEEQKRLERKAARKQNKFVSFLSDKIKSLIDGEGDGDGYDFDNDENP